MEKHLDPKSQQRYSVNEAAAAANPYNEKLTVMPAVGDKLGPNTIQALIGEGGSSSVFKVWHGELEVVRAVKILKQGFKADARERFFTEAKILADIRHPNITDIFGIGYTDEQVPYLELEYVDGVSIKDMLTAGGKMPVAAGLAIAYFVCQALHYSHIKDYTLYGKIYRGLIHRDIKPENILVSMDGGVKLMDFGIARPSEVSLHTVGAKVMGTLVYLSPEQLSGQALDHRSDIFSLGTVLYEMITGSRAFPQKTLTEIVQKKSAGQYRSITSYGIPFPDRLVRVMEKSLSVDPADRYSSASEMGAAIYGVLKEVSDLSPYDVVASYMKDPLSIPEWKPSAQSKEYVFAAGEPNKKAGLPWALIATAAAAGAAAVGIMSLFFVGS
ncbi:MAG: serine/threonine protein kinase [Chitinispirillia bacterium]|nr:serine/threonine protein kinase [Chitinispirillia bacterium]MCL2268871.1 serine/threonine protein kinase [Chitinispirillia bacterium]